MASQLAVRPRGGSDLASGVARLSLRTPAEVDHSWTTKVRCVRRCSRRFAGRRRTRGRSRLAGTWSPRRRREKDRALHPSAEQDAEIVVEVEATITSSGTRAFERGVIARATSSSDARSRTSCLRPRGARFGWSRASTSIGSTTRSTRRTSNDDERVGNMGWPSVAFPAWRLLSYPRARSRVVVSRSSNAVARMPRGILGGPIVRPSSSLFDASTPRRAPAASGAPAERWTPPPSAADRAHRRRLARSLGLTNAVGSGVSRPSADCSAHSPRARVARALGVRRSRARWKFRFGDAEAPSERRAAEP